MTRSPTISCPDCEEPLAFTFFDTSGVGAHKRGDNFNTTPDTAHYICFLCEKAWKRRLSGPLTSDVVGDLAFFCCRVTDCGNRLAVVEPSETFTEIVLACSRGHRHAVVAGDGGGLVIAPA